MNILPIIILLNVFNNINANLTDVILTRNGPVQGIITESEDGLVHRFMGIPYASVDPNNKFGDPLPVTPWEETYQADREAIYCPQYESLVLNDYVGDLNCLVLNVYTPPIIDRNEHLPVMIYSHGGAFRSGHGGPTLFGPEKLVRHDVILVTINYRLGLYGFMCLGNDQVPGNAAVKDALEALRWVVGNIEAFGGDFNNITLFGESAGAYLTELLMLSPASTNLFHKAILQSGTVIPSILSTDYTFNRDTTNQLAVILGFQDSNLSNVIEFLSSVPPLELIAVQQNLSLEFRPCMEVESQTALVYKQPIEFLLADNFETKPIIFGVTDKEGMGFFDHEGIEALIEANSPLLEELFPETLANVETLSFNSFLEREEVARITRQFYFGDGDIYLDGLFDMRSDVNFIHRTDRTVSHYSRKHPGPVFYFVFTYDGDRNYLKKIFNLTYSGAAHSDPLGYLFTQSFMDDDITDRDRIMIDRMTTMWTNFAKYGDPTPDTSELLPVKWLPVEENVQNYLRIDTNMSSGKRAFSNRMAFWDLIYKNYATPLPSTAGNDAFRMETSVIGLFLLLQASLLFLNKLP